MSRYGIHPAVTFGLLERFVGRGGATCSWRLTAFESTPEGVRPVFCVAYGADVTHRLVLDAWAQLFNSAPLHHADVQT